MWDGFNKRKFPRLNLHCEISIQSRESTKPFKVLTENVGAGGVCVILDKQLNRFDQCRIKLELNSKTAVDCAGKVVWMVPTRDAKSRKTRYDTGIEFQDIDEALKEKLREYLEAQVSK